MTTTKCSIATFAVILLTGVCVCNAAGPQATTQPASKQLPRQTIRNFAGGISSLYRGLASSGLTYTIPAELPDSVLLQTKGLTITQKDLDAHIAQTNGDMRKQAARNAFFLFEQFATRKLLLAETVATTPTTAPATTKKQTVLISKYLTAKIGKIEVSDAEARGFYDANASMMGGATFEQVSGQIKKYVSRQKQQDAIAKYVAGLGHRQEIKINATWLKAQATLAFDNPVDKARRSGKPSLVDFGAKGCRSCDMLKPILDDMKKKYEGKANILFVSVKIEKILAARYGVKTIPVQIFFDKHGNEISRHSGYWPQNKLEKSLAEAGAK